MMKKILLIALYLAIGIAFFVLTYIQHSVKISEGFHAFIYLYQGFFYAFLLVRQYHQSYPCSAAEKAYYIQKKG
jgi:hypothetical protein